MIGDSNDETNFRYKILLTDRQVTRLCKDSANNSSANIKLSKTHLSKIVQLGGYKSVLNLPKIAEEYMKSKDNPRSGKIIF